MKGVSFQNGIEYKILIEGETWSQGDTLTGKLEAVSHNASQPVEGCEVALAEALDRKVKVKSPDAFKIQEKKSSPTSPFAYSFTLPLDARITDKPGSLYLIYGKGEQTETLGQLRLNIQPHLHLREFYELFVTHFRFALKNVTSGKGGFIEVKLEPPHIKDWASLEQVLLHLKRTETTIEAKFIFDRNEIDAGKPGLSTRSVKREIVKTLELKSIIHDFNQRLNKDQAIAAMENVIAEYRSAGWLNS